MLLQGAIGDLKPNEVYRIHQPFLSSHFLSKATVRSLHDHKSILWFFLLHDSYSLSAFPQQPLKFQQPTYGLTVTSSLLPNHPIKVLGCLIEWFSHYHLSNQNLANSLPWRDTSLVYTLSFSTPWLCTPVFPFLITNFKCQLRWLTGEQTQAWPTTSQINSSFMGRVQNKVSPGPQLTFSIWRSSLGEEPNSNSEQPGKLSLDVSFILN